MGDYKTINQDRDGCWKGRKTPQQPQKSYIEGEI